MQSLLSTMDSALFFPEGLPQLWLWSLLRPGPGHTTAEFPDLRHGRGVCDVRDIDAASESVKQLTSALFKMVTQEVSEMMFPGSGPTPWLEVEAAILVVNAIRSTRTPFMLLGERCAPVTDSFSIIVSFRSGAFLALWDEKAPEHRLESVHCNIPNLSECRGLCFLNSPCCFVPPAPSHTPSDLAVNCLILRLRVSSTPEPGALPCTITFDFKPEVWLVRTAHVPPLVRCALCLGAIRERKFNFEGSSKQDPDTIKGGGEHCRYCKIPSPQGTMFPRFLLCEFCSQMPIPNVPLRVLRDAEGTHNASDINKMRAERDLFPSLSLSQMGPSYRCCHILSKSANRVQDVVWTILRPQEFMKGAQFFLDFTLSGTWLEDLAPSLIVDTQRISAHLVWDAFFRVYVKNSQCNRAKLAIFAVQFALNLTGMFAPSQKAQKREVFFKSRLPFDRLLQRAMSERVVLLTEMANGLIRYDVLARMARRLLKYLNGDMWGQVLYCSCTNTNDQGTSNEDCLVGLKQTRCDGPSLELGLDGGIAERLSWGAFNPVTSEQVRRLRIYQTELKSISNRTSKVFKEGEHVRLPPLV